MGVTFIEGMTPLNGLNLANDFAAARGLPYAHTTVLNGSKSQFVFGNIEFKSMRVLQEEIHSNNRTNRLSENAYLGILGSRFLSFHFANKDSYNHFMSSMGIEQEHRTPSNFQASYKSRFWHAAANEYLEAAHLSEQVQQRRVFGYAGKIVNFAFPDGETLKKFCREAEKGRFDTRAHELASLPKKVLT